VWLWELVDEEKGQKEARTGLLYKTVSTPFKVMFQHSLLQSGVCLSAGIVLLMDAIRSSDPISVEAWTAQRKGNMRLSDISTESMVLVLAV
jgi:hypothetical protein